MNKISWIEKKTNHNHIPNLEEENDDWTLHIKTQHHTTFRI